MARPIEVTPILKGKDARVFIEETRSVIVTAERIEWLKAVAAQSKKAEKKK
jgi:hypothetical protein